MEIPVHRLKVLVLDSQPYQVMAMHQLLNGCGVYDVLTAESTEAACLSLMSQGRVDVLVCDVQPDTADGLALLRGLVGSGRVEAVMLFGSGEPALLDSATRAARALGYRVLGSQRKPATSAALLAMLPKGGQYQD